MMNQTDFYQAKLDYEIDSWDLQEALSRSDNIVVVDTRSIEAYDREHIPGAISIPHKTMDKQTTSHLDPSKTYITYCDGIGCNASTKGALKMTQLGFRVKELLGGLDWWVRDGYETHGHEARAGHEIACGC